MEFKVGDVVIVNDLDLHTIIAVDTSDTNQPYCISQKNCIVHESTSMFIEDFEEGIENGQITYIDNITQFEGYSWPLLRHTEIRHARVANTIIARKLYPHYQEDGEYLIIKEKHGNE